MNKFTGISFCFLFLSCFVTINSTQAQCDVKRYHELILEGDNYSKKADYYNAMNAYSAAMIACKDKIPEAQGRIMKLFNTINQLKNVAESAKNKANVANLESEKQRNRADSALSVAKKILEKMYFYDEKFGLAVFKDTTINKKLYGFIDRNGNEVIKFEYLEATPFNELTGFAKVKRENFYYLIDTTKREYQFCDNIELLEDENNEYEAFEMHAMELFQTPKVFKCRRLKILILPDNKFTQIPGTIAQLKDLCFLDLSRGKIDSLTPDLGKLQNLKWLNLSFNKLRSIPPGLGSLSYLSYLNLNANYLTSLPDEIFGLRQLQVLNLRGNNFSAYEKERITRLKPSNCTIIW